MTVRFIATKSPYFNVSSQDTGPRFSGEYIAEFVDSTELGSATGLCIGIASLVQDEVPHPTSESITDSNALFETGIVDVVGF